MYVRRLLITSLVYAIAGGLFLSMPLLAGVQPQKSLESTDKSGKSDEKKPNEQPASGGKKLESVEKSSSKPGGKALEAVDPNKVKKVPELPKLEARKIELPEHVERFRERDRYRHDRVAKPRPEIEKPPSRDSNITDPGPEYPEMVAIPAGTFEMGSESGLKDESPVHNVKLSSFEIGKYEITNRQYRAFVNATGYETLAEYEEREFTWADYAGPGRDRFPVVLIAWEDAMEYCKWLSSVTGDTYRLPTEAEWEYAARGGTRSKAFPWGDKGDVSKANFATDESRSSYSEPVLDFIRPVGTYEPNGYGLYDVIGNVWEWCYDWYGENYYKNSPPENPLGPVVGETRVRRGGGWGNPSSLCRVSLRQSVPNIFKSPSLGFRVVKVIKADQ